MAVQQHQLIIGGNRRDACSGRFFDVLAPADGRVLAQVARAEADDVELAVSAARRGYKQWSSLAPGAREAALLRAADIIAAEGEARLLDALIDESGSVITKARHEINYTIDLLRTAAGEVRRLYGDTFPNDRPERLSMVFREPLGVVAIVSPYNAPLSLLAKMTAFPLAAGNSVIIKPSEETPLTALAFAEILLEAGIPATAVSVVTGYGAECGESLVAHADIDCVALTGSTRTGVAVGSEAMKHMRRCQLELGGKSAMLVLRDADPVAAAGIAALKQAAESIHLGDLRDERSGYGPLINRAAADKVLVHVEQAVAAGAQLLTGGELTSGLTIKPTVLLNPPRDCDAWCEESFGPVVSVVVVDSLDEAIEVANDSQYGLSAAVLTDNIQWGFRAARGIRAGSVHIGMHAFQSNALAPIGGYGMSGIGRSGGKYSTEEFTELKWVSVAVEEEGR